MCLSCLYDDIKPIVKPLVRTIAIAVAMVLIIIIPSHPKSKHQNVRILKSFQASTHCSTVFKISQNQTKHFSFRIARRQKISLLFCQKNLRVVSSLNLAFQIVNKLNSIFSTGFNPLSVFLFSFSLRNEI